MPEMPSLAILMLVFRLTHVVATTLLMIVLFGSTSVIEYMSKHQSAMMNKVASWRGLLHYDFVKANITMTGVTLFLCALNITLLQMLPWNNTPFYEESQGFPSKLLMRFALCIDMIQASVSALCSMIYIGSALTKGVKDPTTSIEAKIFFGLSIVASLMTVIMSIVVLFFQYSIGKTGPTPPIRYSILKL